jgi:hypothetical protein
MECIAMIAGLSSEGRMREAGGLASSFADKRRRAWRLSGPIDWVLFGAFNDSIGCGASVRHEQDIIPSVAASTAVLAGMHALADFSLQVQAVALTFVPLLGAGVAQSDELFAPPSRLADDIERESSIFHEITFRSPGVQNLRES